MSNHNSIQDTISRAQSELNDIDVNNTKKPAPDNDSSRTLTLVIVLVLLLGYWFVVIRAEDRNIREDLAESALDLFMEADASVLLYFDQTRQLPEALPAAALRPFVDYEKLDADRYVLTVNHAPHNTPVERNVRVQSPPSNINSLLKL